MFTDTAKDVVKTVIDECVNNGEVFTAYDITYTARSKTSENISHAKVKSFVWEYITQNHICYNRDLMILSTNGNPTAFVYYPITKSANDHPLVQKDSNTDSDDNSDDSNTDSDDSDDNIFELTNEKRVNIPKKILNEAGNNDSYSLVIKYPNSSVFGTAKKNQDGRVRITLRDNPSNKVHIEYDNVKKCIIVESKI